MTLAIIMSVAAPLAVILGLIIFKNIVLTYILLYAGVCVLMPLIDILLIRKISLSAIPGMLGFREPAPSVRIGFLLGLFSFTVIFSFFYTQQNTIVDTVRLNSTLADWKLGSIDPALFHFVMILANSVLEEVFWRGYMFHRYMSNTTPLLTIQFTTLFYCSYHLITTFALFRTVPAVILMAAIYAAGLFWGYMRVRYNSIYVPLISHIMADMGIMLAYMKIAYPVLHSGF